MSGCKKEGRKEGRMEGKEGLTERKKEGRKGGGMVLRNMDMNGRHTS